MLKGGGAQWPQGDDRVQIVLTPKECLERQQVLTSRPLLHAEKSPPRRPAGFLFQPLAIPSDPRALAGAARCGIVLWFRRAKKWPNCPDNRFPTACCIEATAPFEAQVSASLKLEAVLNLAAPLGVRESFVDDVKQMAEGHLRMPPLT